MEKGRGTGDEGGAGREKKGEERTGPESQGKLRKGQEMKGKERKGQERREGKERKGRDRKGREGESWKEGMKGGSVCGLIPQFVQRGASLPQQPPEL